MTESRNIRELSMLEWARERLANSERIAYTKEGADREGWFEDVGYWREIVVALSKLSANSGALAAPAGPQDSELLVELLRHKLDVMHSWNSETTVMFTRIWTRAEIQQALEHLVPLPPPPVPPARTE